VSNGEAVDILSFFHLIHIVDDEDEVDAFYGELFAPQTFSAKHWMEREKRWAALWMVSDLVLEVVEPSAAETDREMPLSKFLHRHGQHFHSFAWYVDPPSVRPLFDRLLREGVRIAKPGGGIYAEGESPGDTIFTHPKDTFGQIEFQGLNGHWKGLDPRFQAGWTTQPWREGPLGIERLSHMTTVVRDLEAASRIYEEVLGGKVFHEERSAAKRSAFALLGTDTVIELAQPSDDASRLATDLAGHGELPHSATFLVRDLDSVERHASKVGVGIVDRDKSELTLDPADCFGAVWCFTDRRLPADPRDTA
jgi:extradiol dioxygenase family protein